jgi:hypothetical protein
MKNEQALIKEIKTLLDDGATQISPDTSRKLELARKAALKAMEARSYSVRQLAVTQALDYFVHPAQYQRVWLVAVLGVAALWMFFTQVPMHYRAEPLEADVMLLASDLPPEAYVDKGFDAWLKQSSQL